MSNMGVHFGGPLAGNFAMPGIGALRDYNPPPPPVDRTMLARCECCERYRPTPYSHTQHDPPHQSWVYCQECYDEGCEGPYGDGCYVDCEPDPVLGPCHICADGKDQPLGCDGWCIEHLHLYEEYLENNPIPPKNKFTPVYRGEYQEPAHKPAYCYPPERWPDIDFKPEYLLNPSKAPTARKKAHIVTQQPTETEDERITRLIEEKLKSITGQDISVELPQQAPQQIGRITIEDILEQLDPRDSETAIKMFDWLRDNARLQKVATLDEGGYLFIYQEPKGSSREGWMAGGTQGDRIVDDAHKAAVESGALKTVKGLCRHCFSAISQAGDNPPLAENPTGGASAQECPQNNLGPHEMAG